LALCAFDIIDIDPGLVTCKKVVLVATGVSICGFAINLFQIWRWDA